MTAISAENFKVVQERSRRDPVWFITRLLAVNYLTPQQRQICLSIRNNKRTAAPSGHGIGKTFLAACIVLWFLFSFPGAKILTTAPTWFQVENLLWREVRMILSKSIFAGMVKASLTGITLADDWFAIGLSTNDPTRFQGIHAPYVLIVFDEATGVDGEIWDAAEGVAVGMNDKFLAIGNPTDPTSEFKRKCDSELWNVVHLSAEEHPNVVEDREVVAGAVTKQWIQERLTEYGGADTALYRARVLGKFPDQGDDMLISLADIERAQERWRRPLGLVPIALGVDVARFGSDETVEIEIFADGTVGEPRASRGQDLMTTAGRVKVNPSERKAVDDSGLGGGVTDRLVEQHVDVLAFISGERAIDPERFYNRRTEAWWMIRELLKSDELSLPPDNKLAADLTNIKFKYTSRGQIKLEAKDEIKKRLGRSPDRGDALAIAVAAYLEPVVDNSFESGVPYPEAWAA
jgi:phage terminase large subunit